MKAKKFIAILSVSTLLLCWGWKVADKTSNEWDLNPFSKSTKFAGKFRCNNSKIKEFLRMTTLHEQNDSSNFELPAKYSKQVPPKAVPHCGINEIIPRKVLQGSHKWMIYIVKSSPSNLQRRLAVRETWLAESKDDGLKNFSAIFVVGNIPDEKLLKEVIEENLLYGDILQCEFEESYRNLPIKVLSAIGWILSNDVIATYYSVTDDDVIVIVPRIINHFSSVEDQEDFDKKFYCGYVYDDDAKPFRSSMSKWAMSLQLYSSSAYPTFCHGALWTTSLIMLQGIHCVAEITDHAEFFIEDVLLTGILRVKLGLGVSHISETIDKRKHKKDDLLIAHLGKLKSTVIPSAIRNQWKKLKRNNIV